MKTLTALVIAAVVAAVAFWYVSSIQKQPAASPPPEQAVEQEKPTEPTTPALLADNRPVAEILRGTVKWPTKIAIRVPLTIALFENSERVGEATLAIGQILSATAITDEGMLKLAVAQQTVELEMENTDFLDRAINAKTAPATEAEARAPSGAEGATNANVARARREQSAEQQLIALKQRFPPKYRTAVGTITKDRAVNPSNIRTIKVGG
jgi:hypothetical protein